MKIALIGYGKMGKAIEIIATERGHQICAKFNSSNPITIEKLKNSQADVAIEFTQPKLASSHIRTCVDAKTPVVVGTTAWQNELPELNNFILDNDGSMLYASNFSVGVNIFFKLNQLLARLMNKQSDYLVSIEEIHHVQKLDAPSGTAVTLADGLVNELDAYKNWKLLSDETCDIDTIPVKATRLPEVPGTHIIKYESDIDFIELKHEAKNRKGFALGAVVAAEFLKDKKGIFTMNDVLNL
ncbi:MAG: 4-hydroxy-tetrahydrodipicolinate reductase [Crocinitomicaceae bacterium]